MLRLPLISAILALAIACSGIPTSESGIGTLATDDALPPAPEKTNSVQFEKIARALNLPAPEDFRVQEGKMFSGTPRAVVLRDRRSRQYRTVIGEAARRGPNFAGHYTIITWGAGMGNFSLAVADAITGELIFPPFESISRAGYDLQFNEEEPRVPAFRKESTLIAFMGCPGKEYEGCSDWDKDGFYIYNFEKGQFKLLRFVTREEFNATGRNNE